LLEKDVKLLLENFGTLDKIFDAKKEALIKILKNENIVESLIYDLDSLREKIMNGKRV